MKKLKNVKDEELQHHILQFIAPPEWERRKRADLPRLKISPDQRVFVQSFVARYLKGMDIYIHQKGALYEIKYMYSRRWLSQLVDDEEGNQVFAITEAGCSARIEMRERVRLIWVNRLLKTNSTRWLLGLLRQTYATGGYYDFGFEIYADEIKAELATREHIPNTEERRRNNTRKEKGDARRVRQKRGVGRG